MQLQRTLILASDMEIECIATGSREGNCCVVRAGGKTILLDAGVPFRRLQKAVGHRITDIDAAFITHEHQDHFAAVRDLLGYAVTCVMTGATAGFMGLRDHPYVRKVVIRRWYEAEGYRFMPTKAVHDAVDPCGYIIDFPAERRRLLYVTDSAYYRARISGLTDVVIECNYDEESLAGSNDNEKKKERVRNTHMGLLATRAFLERQDLSRVNTIHICHKSDTNADPDTIRETLVKALGKEIIVF